MQKTRVVIGIPSGNGQITAALGKMLFDAGRLSADPDHPFEYETHLVVGHKPVSKARNMIVGKFLSDPTAKKLVMIDADMLPPPLWWTLLGHKDPIVSGMMYGWGRPLEGESNAPVILLSVCYDLDADGKFRSVGTDAQGPFLADAVGAANLVIDRSVLESMTAPWFRFAYNPDDDSIADGEDMAFFRRVRAESGLRVLVDPRVRFGHDKAVDLNDVAQLTVGARNLGYVEGFNAGRQSGEQALIVEEDAPVAQLARRMLDTQEGAA